MIACLMAAPLAFLAILYSGGFLGQISVSYTHLDVYKRQAQYAAKGRESEIDHIPAAEFAAPKSIDFTHGSYLCIDGLYYAYLLIPSDGYKTQVPAGWLSLIEMCIRDSTWLAGFSLQI